MSVAKRHARSSALSADSSSFADQFHLVANAQGPAGPQELGSMTAGGTRELDVTALALPTGVRFYQSNPGVVAGDVSALGDINGDGFDDFVLATVGTTSAYVIFGKASGYFSFDLNNLSGDTTIGFTIRSAASSATGLSVASAGDINNDGYDDIIVGDTAGSAGGALSGDAYVIYGHSGTSFANASGGRLLLASIGAAGFRIQGDSAGDLAGSSVSSAGDINNDGFDDFMIGTPGGDDGGSDAGEVYVIFGKAGGYSAIDLTSLAPADGFVIQGDTAGDGLGGRVSISSAGDINNDGFDDIIVGAKGGDDGGTDAGEAYVLFGGAGGFGSLDGSGRNVVDLTSLAPAAGFVIRGSQAGAELGPVTSAGDINGDGFEDIIIGAPGANVGSLQQAGMVYVLFGKASGFGTVDGSGRNVVDLTSLSAADGFTIAGTAANGRLGSQVASAGDVNGDGLDDLLVAGPGTSTSRHYLIWGQDDGFGVPTAGGGRQIDLSSPYQATDIIGFTSGNRITDVISAAGDINNDGFGDLLIGGNDSSDVGFVVFGRSFDPDDLTDPSRNNIYGTSGDDTLIGTSAADTIQAFEGNDTLDGGANGDILAGGPGDDTYYVDQSVYPGDVIIENVGEGYDRAYSATSFGVGSAEVELLAVTDPTTTNAVQLTGNSFDQEIIGNAGSNILVGGGGTDILRGLGGNDEYRVSSLATVIYEAVGGGTDVVVVGLNNYVLAAGVEIEGLYLSDSSFTHLTGNEFAQSLVSSSPNTNNVFDGGGGADGMLGGGGDDTYIVQDDDVVIEAAGQGNDTVRVTAVGHALVAGQSVELLTAFDTAGTAALYLYGNDLAQTIRGNAGANIISGGGGADTLEGLAGDDRYIVQSGTAVVVEAAGQGYDIVYTTVSYSIAGISVEVISALDPATTNALNLTGNELGNGVHGNAGANILDGGAGVDRMVGFAGDDIYIVDDAADIAVEIAGAGQGNDTIRTTVNYVLDPDNPIETLIAFDPMGTGALNLSGNNLANRVEGNEGVNILSGGYLGLSGSDTLVGHGGDDRYIVDSQLDTVVELDGEGYDIVYTTASYALTVGNSIEVLSALDSTTTNSINLTGNEFANWVHGNNGANTISGGNLEISGIDRLVGFLGDDRYIVDDSADVVIEYAGQGFDYIYTIASYTLTAGLDIEVLSALDANSTNPMDLLGNEIGQGVYGNNGGNLLDGGGGADRLAGFGGADTFRFTTALGGGNIDTIVDFSVPDDTIALDDAVFAGLTPGALPAGAFVIGAAAADADDRIIYNSTTGQLFYDADGNGAGAAVHFADISAGLALTASDFTVI